jgi:hypothetical protein
VQKHDTHEQSCTTIEEGSLLDYITNKPVADNAKEQVRQRLALALFHEYGISVEDMEPDFRLKLDGRIKEVLFIERCLDWLKEGGCLGIVLTRCRSAARMGKTLALW